MGFLAMAFAAGALAIGFPIVFHLIRRTPRGKQEFSSLMFLSASPPTLTRRSRLDHLLLLLLRAAIICLLVLAFMRPFFRENINMLRAGIPARRIAIVMDTSASMRSGNLWTQAVEEAEQLLRDLEPLDDIALYTFDSQLRSIIPFEPAATALTRVKQNDKVELIRAELAGSGPTWQRTDLAQVLIGVAEELENLSVGEELAAASQIVLVSDLQEGAEIQALQSYDWPESVRVDIRRMALANGAQASNATLRVVAGELGNRADEISVRVANGPESDLDRFVVRWGTAASANESLGAADASLQNPGQQNAGGFQSTNERAGSLESGAEISEQLPESLVDSGPLAGGGFSGASQLGEVAYFVPAGNSQVLSVPRLPVHRESKHLVLQGDRIDFDNSYFYVPPRQQQYSVGYLGADKVDDPNQMLFYLETALLPNELRQVELVIDEDEVLAGLDSLDLVVAGAVMSDAIVTRVAEYVEAGGHLLLVLPTVDQAMEWRAITGDFTTVENQAEDAILAEIDFAHPLFAPFALARYNDFTGIRFWNHLRVRYDFERPPGVEDPAGSEQDSKVLARFDDGTLALGQRQIGLGNVLILTASWSPEDSQFALSSKFSPLINGMLGLSRPAAPSLRGLAVGDPIQLATESGAGRSTIIRPDGATDVVPADAADYSRTDLPGVYKITGAESAEDRYVAVNLDLRESWTRPMPAGRLADLGIRTGMHSNRTDRLTQMQLLRDRELEDRQKIWKWILFAACVLLVVEIFVAGHATRSQQIPPEVQN